MKIFYFTEDVASPEVNEKIIQSSLNFLGFRDAVVFQQEGIKILGADINNLKNFQTLISNILAKAILEEEKVIFCFHIDTEVSFDIFQRSLNGEIDLLENGTILKKYLRDYQEIIKTLFKAAMQISENLKSDSFVEMFPCRAIESWCAANQPELIIQNRQVRKELAQIINLPFLDYLQKLDEIEKFKFGKTGRQGKGLGTMLKLVNNNFPTKEFYGIEKSFHRFVENLRLAIN
ncbi:MAG: hypothetical protein DWQ06_10280 [Calditrichaeota bacterium]|nr:MAG: hypothetical protein DWQ06_10280 [Calditrichota bacterium]